MQEHFCTLFHAVSHCSAFSWLSPTLPFSLFSVFWDSVSPYSLHEVHIDIKNRTVSEVPVQKWIQRGTAHRRLPVEWTELTPHWYQYLITDAASWETKARVWVVAGADVPGTPGARTRWNEEHVCLMFTPSILPSSLYSFLLEMESDFVSEIGLELGAQVVFLLHSPFWEVGTVGTFRYPSCSCCFLNESWRLGDPAMGLTYFRVKRSWLCYLTLDDSGQLVHISGREGGAGKLVGLASLYLTAIVFVQIIACVLR